MDNCAEDLELFDKFVEPGLLAKLSNVVENGFARITYAEAIEIMHKSGKECGRSEEGRVGKEG